MVVAEDYARGMGQKSRLQDDTDIHNGLANAAFRYAGESEKPVGLIEEHHPAFLMMLHTFIVCLLEDVVAHSGGVYHGTFCSILVIY